MGGEEFEPAALQRRGQTLTEMRPEQRRAIVDFMRNSSAQSFWRAQSTAVPLSERVGHMRVRQQLAEQADRIEEAYL